MVQILAFLSYMVYMFVQLMLLEYVVESRMWVDLTAHLTEWARFILFMVVWFSMWFAPLLQAAAFVEGERERHGK